MAYLDMSGVQASQCRYTVDPTKQRAGITMDECETVYEEVPVAQATYINLGSSTVSVQPENREEHVLSPRGTAHTEEHSANTEKLGNIVREQTPTTKQRNIRAVLCFLLGLGIGAGLSLAIGYYMISQDEQNIAATLIKDSKSEITLQTKDLNESVLFALEDIHSEVQGLKNALNISLAIGYYMISQEMQNIAANLIRVTKSEITQQTKYLNELENTTANLIRETKSAITQQTKAVNESVMLAFGDMEARIHMEVQWLKNDSTTEMKKELKALTDNLTTDVGQVKMEMVNMMTQVNHLEELENTTANLIRETKSAITQQTKAVNESVMLAVGDMEARIHMEVQCLKNDSTTDDSAKYRPVNHMKTSCAAIHVDDPNMASGVYNISPGGNLPQRAVYCDMSTDCGGWTVIQRRHNGSLQFNRTWAVYKHGFGSAYGELWIGNTALHQLTANESCDLRVDLTDWEGQHRYAVYSNFSVANEADNYRLITGGYSGTAGDSLGIQHHNARQFSTTDRDNDGWSVNSCVNTYGGGGGWWYGRCYYANLNGRYDRHGNYSGGTEDGVVWHHWRGVRYSLKAVSMMVRPRH